MTDLPEELKYSKDHEWVKLDGDIATVGISDYAQSHHSYNDNKSPIKFHSHILSFL